jgi:penicillin-binding protein 1A
MSKYNHPHDDEDQTADKPKGSFLVRFLLKFTILSAGLALSGALLLGMALALAWPNLPDLNAMTDYRPRVPLRVFTADKVLIGEFGEERRNVLRFDEIPDVMKSAVLSAEDDRFYQHGGIDWIGVVRAGLTNLIAMQKSQGASTITMQVARNFYLSSEKTWSRKFYELLLTFKIEASLSKDQILELYLNQIYLGHRAYGFAAASRVYLGKELSEITAADAALLAGIPKAPSRFNPIANKPRAVLRQRYVLGRMHSLGYLTDAEYKAALAQPVVIKPSQGTPAGGYAVHGEYAAELARQLMISIYPDNVYTRGLNVYTTIHSKDQQWAYDSLREGVLDYTRRAPYPGPEAQLTLPADLEKDPAKLDEFLDGVFDKHPDRTDMLTGVVLSVKPNEVRVARSSTEIIVINDKKALGIIARALNPKAPAAQRLQRGSVVYLHKTPAYWEILNLPTVQAAFVAMLPQDGSLRAMVGGFDFYHGNFNRVTQAWRQPGSAFKPFIYAASLERGLTPGTMISDQPFELSAEQTGSGKAWAPKNYGGEYGEMMSMREAIARSKNMVSIRILQSIGPQYAQDYIARFGFDKAKHPAVLPMALGSGAVTPMQLAAGFSVFANGGYRVTPYLIDHGTDAKGQVLMRS